MRGFFPTFQHSNSRPEWDRSKLSKLHIPSIPPIISGRPVRTRHVAGSNVEGPNGGGVIPICRAIP
jgi:hypothetical protein